ncbi:putative F-box associated interaction domain-containing protein [Rosa chinensis]|uniref:Putative F-box associated interaction domain-containing protein n=1 Tax=Rosa chinensis TaxID=74649 RepID=A0A2P6RJL1_ROSCH|nr:putative F-box associated interaction domain-containing protein [Rosa chinensis]
MEDQGQFKAIEDKGQRLVFTDHARKRLYSLDLVQFLNQNLALLRNNNVDGLDLVAKPTELDFVRRNIGSGWVPVVLSCNSFLMCRSDSGFHLINPVTKEWKKVPKTPLTKKPFSWELYGFGFDDSTNQYKVVEGKGCTDGFVFSVYASLTDSWRKIDCLYPYKQTRVCRKDGMVLNGGVHWLVKRDESLVIISFLLAEEEVKEIQVPPNCCTGVVELGIFRDRLCITLFSFSISETYNEFWVMKEYGVRGSWTKMEIGIPYHRLLHSGFWTETYDLMLVDATMLAMCNFNDKSFWILSIRHGFGQVGGFGSMSVYVESRKPLIDQEQQEKSKDDGHP